MGSKKKSGGKLTPAERLRQQANPARKKSGKLGGRPKRMKRAAGWDPEAILGMASRGAEPGDIEIGCKLDLSDPVRRAEFEQIVEYGHAKHKLELTDRSYREAVVRGKTTPLKESLAAWIPRYADDVASSWAAEITGAKERLRAMIEKLNDHKRKLKEGGDAA